MPFNYKIISEMNFLWEILIALGQFIMHASKREWGLCKVITDKFPGNKFTKEKISVPYVSI